MIEHITVIIQTSSIEVTIGEPSPTLSDFLTTDNAILLTDNSKVTTDQTFYFSNQL